jgi:3-phenylpropionate/trans-cinnamate dioxygenase ferredoxin subunit
MAIVELAKTTDIPAGKMKIVTSGKNEILISNIDGKYFAIGGKCTHASGNLAQGILSGSTVTCPRHGSQFDVTTGKVVGGPARIDEPVYQLLIEGNVIKINI